MQLFDLKGKTALITGASSGLGEQFARCLSSAGVRVLLAAQLREVSRGRQR
jgi:NADP-dependent 3-hydroxy acid dehydrogenase YdfG